MGLLLLENVNTDLDATLQDFCELQIASANNYEKESLVFMEELHLIVEREVDNKKHAERWAHLKNN